MSQQAKRGRPRQQVLVPAWYQPIMDQRARVRETHASSLAHFEEILAVGELLGRELPLDVRNQIAQVLRQVDAMKVSMRALYLASRDEWTEMNERAQQEVD
jgi:hypothetical protein